MKYITAAKNRHTRVRAFASLACVLALAGTAAAQLETNENTKIAFAGSQAEDRFAQAVATSGDLAVMGAPFEDGFLVDDASVVLCPNTCEKLRRTEQPRLELAVAVECEP